VSNDKSQGETINLLVYNVCHADGFLEYRFHPEEDLEKEGAWLPSKPLTLKLQCGFTRWGRSRANPETIAV
jgi:hypothetical protein